MIGRHRQKSKARAAVRPFDPRVVIACDSGEPAEVLFARATPREQDLLSGISHQGRFRQSLLARLAGHSAIEQILLSGRRGNCIDIVKGPNGEPLVYVDGKVGLVSLSLAHSGLLGVAVAWRGDQRELAAGVDVERVRETDVSESSYAFSQSELRLIARRRDEEDLGLIAWSAKEAAWKALQPRADWGPDTVEIQRLDTHAGHAEIKTRGQALVRLGPKTIDVRIRKVKGPDGQYILSLARLGGGL